eukprot:CAMPEP_0115109928 /NCGR_PEP_ID=MMETSP0227-20121206/39040_1 /TAXON_ID=89957 /ORGANISM="Polarella glacialis, Strain CCMP 1383" /LENGTH=55 /DNA_ID=CAMNT_0002508805 /DNA_START=90 /DNA_END=254 /DNA_ORIENTATION=+
MAYAPMENTLGPHPASLPVLTAPMKGDAVVESRARAHPAATTTITTKSNARAHPA